MLQNIFPIFKFGPSFPTPWVHCYQNRINKWIHKFYRCEVYFINTRYFFDTFDINLRSRCRNAGIQGRCISQRRWRTKHGMRTNRVNFAKYAPKSQSRSKKMSSYFLFATFYCPNHEFWYQRFYWGHTATLPILATSAPRCQNFQLEVNLINKLNSKTSNTAHLISRCNFIHLYSQKCQSQWPLSKPVQYKKTDFPCVVPGGRIEKRSHGARKILKRWYRYGCRERSPEIIISLLP